jgi:hypothetical protein
MPQLPGIASGQINRFILRTLRKTRNKPKKYRKSQNNIKPTNDFLFLEKEEPNLNKEYALERVEKIHTKEHDREEGKIVGVVEPKGFWSKFIMNQKLGFIFARVAASENKGEGFWTNLIKAQDISQGKDKGKGR